MSTRGKCSESGKEASAGKETSMKKSSLAKKVSMKKTTSRPNNKPTIEQLFNVTTVMVKELNTAKEADELRVHRSQRL